MLNVIVDKECIALDQEEKDYLELDKEFKKIINATPSFNKP